MPATSASPSLKHGLAAGAAGQPASPDWTIEQGWERYTPDQHAIWRTLFERQMHLLQGRACDEFVAGMQALPIAADQIPDFRRMSEALMKRTGWQVVAVPGLVPDEVFFEHLAQRRFPAGQFIRRADQLDYLEEPDVFHDVFGHVPMLMNPIMADFIQAYGEGGLRAQRLGHLEMLARVYWYTVEFGLVRQGGRLRIYGGGIASSWGESLFCLDSPSPHRVRFELERVMRTRYRIDDFQECYFVLDRLDELLALAQVDFGPLYEQVAGQTPVSAGQLLPDDIVLTHGDGSYHQQSHT